MVVPPICAWMEQTGYHMTLRIIPADVRRLIEIPGAAGQRPVCRRVLATTGDRDDMFHLQGQIEHGFGRMTILTAMTSPQRHLGIVWVHRPNASASVAARAAEACISASISASSSVCSSGGKVAP